MANYNLTNQDISQSFNQLVQIDSGSSLRDGTGSLIDNISITSSHAISASYAVSASFEIVKEISSSYADFAPYDGILNKPTLVSGSSQINYPDISNIPSGIVSSSSQVSFNGITDKPTLVSGSSQIILQDTTGNLSGSRIDGLVTSASFATTASFALNVPTIPTGSFATTGSNVFIGNQTITGSLLISGSEVVNGPLTASRLQINGITDLNGTIDVSNDATFRGNVIIQSSGEQKLLMRSTSGGGVSQGFDLLIQTSSFIIRDETHDIDFLEFDYISSNGDHILKLEANRFEMNSGSLGISGSLTASLQQGYAWVGDSSGITQAIPTSSFVVSIDTGSLATTGSNTFNGNQNIIGELTSSVVQSNVLVNPQTITDNITVGPDNNAFVVGPVTIEGSVNLEGDSELYIFTPPPLGEYLTTASYQIDSASFDTRINNVSFDTGALATTGSNSFIGNQNITGSILLYDENGEDYSLEFMTSSGEFVKMGWITGSEFVPPAWVINHSFGGDILSIGKDNGWFEFNTVFNLNNNANFRALTEFRNVRQQPTYTSSLERIEVNTVAKLTPQDPLPTGSLGELAVSGSVLYFHNGTNWSQIN
jgi:hypothetical protein